MFREMVRKKQALPEERIKELLKNEKRGVLSVLGEHGYPYGIPMNFWYEEESGKIYFHSGKTGHKVDALRKNNKVSFCIYDDGFRKEGEWALNISSVVVFGRMEVVEDFEKAMDICRKLSLKYTPDETYIGEEIRKSGKATLCYELTPEYITGKLVNES